MAIIILIGYNQEFNKATWFQKFQFLLLSSIFCVLLVLILSQWRSLNANLFNSCRKIVNIVPTLLSVPTRKLNGLLWVRFGNMWLKRVWKRNFLILKLSKEKMYIICFITPSNSEAANKFKPLITNSFEARWIIVGVSYWIFKGYLYQFDL